MVKAAPAASFVISEPDLLLELLIVAFDPPAQLGEVDQAPKRGVVGKIGQPILGRLAFIRGPLDQQPLFGSALGKSVVAACRSHPHARKSGTEPIRRAFAPPDGAPSVLGKRKCKLLDAGRPVVGVAAQPLRRPPATTRPRLRWQ